MWWLITLDHSRIVISYEKMKIFISYKTSLNHLSLLARIASHYVHVSIGTRLSFSFSCACPYSTKEYSIAFRLTTNPNVVKVQWKSQFQEEDPRLVLLWWYSEQKQLLTSRLTWHNQSITILPLSHFIIWFQSHLKLCLGSSVSVSVPIMAAVSGKSANSMGIHIFIALSHLIQSSPRSPRWGGRQFLKRVC